MKTFFRNFALLVVGLITLASCASTTIINSVLLCILISREWVQRLTLTAIQRF